MLFSRLQQAPPGVPPAPPGHLPAATQLLVVVYPHRESVSPVFKLRLRNYQSGAKGFVGLKPARVAGCGSSNSAGCRHMLWQALKATHSSHPTHCFFACPPAILPACAPLPSPPTFH